MSFQIEVFRDEGYLVLTPLEGCLNRDNSENFISTAQNAIKGFKGLVIFDLINIYDIDSFGISRLIYMKTYMDALGGNMCLCRVQKRPLTSLEVTRLTYTVFEVFADTEAAIASRNILTG